MVNQKVTPEERLLRLIESGEKVEVGENETETGSIWKVGSWPKILSHSPNSPIRRWSFFQAMRPEFNLRLLNRVLVGVLIFLVVIGIAYELNNTRTIPTDLKGQPEFLSTSPGNQGEGELKLASIAPLPDYLNEVAKRNIFAPMSVHALKPQKPQLKKMTPVKPPPPNPLQILQEKVKVLKLVGISWGKDPVAMIEDKTSQQTSFLKVGDSINGVKVKAILSDRAILSHGDAEYDLF